MSNRMAKKVDVACGSGAKSSGLRGLLLPKVEDAVCDEEEMEVKPQMDGGVMFVKGKVTCLLCHTLEEEVNIHQHVSTAHFPNLRYACIRCEFKTQMLHLMEAHLKDTTHGGEREFIDKGPESAYVGSVVKWFVDQFRLASVTGRMAPVMKTLEESTKLVESHAREADALMPKMKEAKIVLRRMNPEEIEAHVDPTRSVEKCRVCRRNIPSGIRKMIGHVRNDHFNGNVYHCHHCQFWSPMMKVVKRHSLKNHRGKPPKCDEKPLSRQQILAEFFPFAIMWQNYLKPTERFQTAGRNA